MLMDPAFPDIVGAWAAEQIDDRAKVWSLSRGTDGKLKEQLDESFLARLQDAESVEELVDAIVASAGRREIEQSRAW
jgi:hypothetical protein